MGGAGRLGGHFQKFQSKHVPTHGSRCSFYEVFEVPVALPGACMLEVALKEHHVLLGDEVSGHCDRPPNPTPTSAQCSAATLCTLSYSIIPNAVNENLTLPLPLGHRPHCDRPRGPLVLAGVVQH